VILQTKSFETDEVLISAKAIMNTEASLLAKRQKSIAVSAEQFQKAGSSNAADAAKQIVGASVVNGKDVYIRGLGDRYTSTNLNGIQIPSADPYKRSGSIDIIPSNLIDNIQAVKSFTPDKPGDFSGGTVDVKTKDFPDQFNLSLSAAAKYNSELSFNDNGLRYNGSSTDWLVYDDGKKTLPSCIGTTPWVADITKITFSEALDPRPEVGGPAYQNLGNYITSVKRISTKSINVTDYELSQNYPNPFNPITKIRFSIPTSSMINLSVYNILGQKAATLVNSVKPAGTYEVDFSASSATGGLSSGIYIYILKSQNNFIIKKMTLIK